MFLVDCDDVNDGSNGAGGGESPSWLAHSLLGVAVGGGDRIRYESIRCDRVV